MPVPSHSPVPANLGHALLIDREPTETEWDAVLEQLRIRWPKAKLHEVADELKAHAPLFHGFSLELLMAGVDYAFLQGRTWPPGSSTLLQICLDLLRPLPDWDQMMRLFNAHTDAPQPWVCPYDACDGRGFVVDDVARQAVPCRCHEQMVDSRRGATLDTDAVASTFIAELSAAEYRGVRDGDTTSISQVRRRWDEYLARQRSGLQLLLLQRRHPDLPAVDRALAELATTYATQSTPTPPVAATPDLEGLMPATAGEVLQGLSDPSTSPVPQSTQERI